MKKLLCVLLCAAILLGLSGCGFIEGIKSRQNRTMIETLVEYLEDKYDEEFEMVKLVKRFDGNYGVHYYGTFRSLERPDIGTIYLLQEGNERLAQREINGKTWYVKENYALVILQSQYAEGLQEALGDGVMVKCRMHPSNIMLSQEEFDAGLKAYIEEEDSYRTPWVFVFADNSKADGELRDAAEAYMSQYNPYKQYLYMIYSDTRFSKWEELYYENLSNFHNDLDEELDMWSERIEASIFERDAGLVKTVVIKE